MYTLLQLESKTFGELKKIGYELNVLPPGDRRRRQSWIDALVGVNPPLLQLLEVSPGVEVDRAQEPIIETVEASPAAEAEQAQEPPIESKFGRIVYPRPGQKPIVPVAENPLGVELDPVPKPIVSVAENSPAVELDQVEEPLPECFECFGDGYIEDEFGRVKFCQCEPKLSRQKTQSAIVPSATISLKPKSDRNPILTGICLSDRFLARYSPPQSETLHYEITDGSKVGSYGQLSLFEVSVVTEPEPPDPDDFESIDAFREAIARWDWEHPSSFEPNSVHSEPNSVHCEPPEISLDSFSEWAPCPAHWYEPAALDCSSKVLEMSPTSKSSITSDFFIPTFGGLGDRSNRSDEPPDTGIFARLPKPKPPTFPPQASQPKSAQVSQASRNYPETIPKLFHRVVAGSTLPARSPPGGDARRGQ